MTVIAERIPFRLLKIDVRALVPSEFRACIKGDHLDWMDIVLVWKNDEWVIYFSTGDIKTVIEKVTIATTANPNLFIITVGHILKEWEEEEAKKL